jgi:hypothetical protein
MPTLIQRRRPLVSGVLGLRVCIRGTSFQRSPCPPSLRRKLVVWRRSHALRREGTQGGIAQLRPHAAPDPRHLGSAVSDSDPPEQPSRPLRAGPDAVIEMPSSLWTSNLACRSICVGQETARDRGGGMRDPRSQATATDAPLPRLFGKGGLMSSYTSGTLTQSTVTALQPRSSSCTESTTSPLPTSCVTS